MARDMKINDHQLTKNQLKKKIQLYLSKYKDGLPKSKNKLAAMKS